MNQSWVSLAQTIEDGALSPGLPSGARVQKQRDDGVKTREIQVTLLSTSVHTGTHIDAPRHFVPNGKTIDQYPSETFQGSGYVLDASNLGASEVTDDWLQANAGDVKSGEILFIYFGHGHKYGTAEYFDYPYFGKRASQWLVKRGIRIVGTDTPSPDLPAPRRTGQFDFPAHAVLLGSGVLIIENLSAALGEFAGEHIEVLCFPVPVSNADGAACTPLIRRHARKVV